MSYRKVIVGDKTYEYVIGKDVIKVKGVGLFKTSDYGIPVGYNDGASNYNAEKVNFVAGNRVAVTPAIVRSLILGTWKPYQTSCVRHGVREIKMLCVDPFGAEIETKSHLMHACPECFANLAGDI